MSRATARAAAMQMIYEKLAGGQGGEDTLAMVYEELRQETAGTPEPVNEGEPGKDDKKYILKALEGVLDHLDEIDRLIEKTAKGWALDRMAMVDLTILRLAIWEILYVPEIPGNVSISEALLLTEKYSDPEDKSFLNGILGTILREHEANA